MRISDWSSDVCSSDLLVAVQVGQHEIQDDDVVIVELPDLKAVFAHIGRVAHIALRAEHHLDALGSGGIVLDKQNSHGVTRSEERRVGKECVSTCSSRWAPSHYKKKTNNSQTAYIPGNYKQ